MFDDLRNLLMPISGVHPIYGLLCFIHIIMPAGNSENELFIKDVQGFIYDCKSLDMVFDHFISTSTAQDDITLRVVFVDDEKLDNIRNWVIKDNRI